MPARPRPCGPARALTLRAPAYRRACHAPRLGRGGNRWRAFALRPYRPWGFWLLGAPCVAAPGHRRLPPPQGLRPGGPASAVPLSRALALGVEESRSAPPCVQHRLPAPHRAACEGSRPRPAPPVEIFCLASCFCSIFVLLLSRMPLWCPPVVGCRLVFCSPFARGCSACAVHPLFDFLTNRNISFSLTCRCSVIF